MNHIYGVYIAFGKFILIICISERHETNVITAGQLRAARALLRLDQRQLAEICGLSAPTIQRMEARDGVVRGNVDSLMKLIAGLEAAGIELIVEGAVSQPGGRGVRLKSMPEDDTLAHGETPDAPPRVT